MPLRWAIPSKAAWEGDEEAGFKAKLDKLRTIGAIYPNYIQIVATADSGIKTLADLKGKSLSVGAPKSGMATPAWNRALKSAAAWTHPWISSSTASLNLGTGRSRMCDGSRCWIIEPDACPMIIGIPNLLFKNAYRNPGRIFV